MKTENTIESVYAIGRRLRITEQIVERIFAMVRAEEPESGDDVEVEVETTNGETIVAMVSFERVVRLFRRETRMSPAEESGWEVMKIESIEAYDAEGDIVETVYAEKLATTIEEEYSWCA